MSDVKHGNIIQPAVFVLCVCVCVCVFVRACVWKTLKHSCQTVLFASVTCSTGCICPLISLIHIYHRIVYGLARYKCGISCTDKKHILDLYVHDPGECFLYAWHFNE